MKKINALQACSNGMFWILTRKAAGEKGPGEGFCRVTFQGAGLTQADRDGLIAAFSSAGDEYFSNKLLAEFDPEPSDEEAELASMEVKKIIDKLAVQEAKGKRLDAERLGLVAVMGGLFGHVWSMVLTRDPFIKKRPHWLKKKKGRS